jgi:nucleoid DNA-binding protein
MNKKELVNTVKDNMGSTRKEAEIAVASVLDAIVDGMVSDGKVSLVGFGTFKVVDRKARTCRNPQTGDPIEVPAKKAPNFKASAALKTAVND